MTVAEVSKLIEKYAKSVPGVDVNLILAFAEIESGFDPWGLRYEPNFSYAPLTPSLFARDAVISLETEKLLQKTSFGLFQIMGLVARELGYKSNLTKLLLPEVNVIWGVEFYRVRCKKRFSKIEDQIAAYNAGTPKKDAHGLYTNQTYVNKVLAAYERFKLLS